MRDSRELASLDKLGFETFRDDNQVLILGDSLEILPRIEIEFDASITDPPYNISGYDNKKEIGWLKSNFYWQGEKKFTKIDEDWDKFSNGDYLEFTAKWLNSVCRLVRPNGNIMIFGTYHNIYKIGYTLEKLDRKIVNSIVWYKRNAFPNITQRMLCESTEYVIWAVNNNQKDAKNWTFNYDLLKKMNNGKQMRNVWDIPLTPPSEKKVGKHPSQKPMEVIERLVCGFTNEGDIVLDPFAGSGTISIVCRKHNRLSLGIESNKAYFNLAKKRLEELDKTKYQLNLM